MINTNPQQKREGELVRRPEPEAVSRKSVPLVSIRGTTIFPRMIFSFNLGREKSLKALDAAMADDQEIFLVEQLYYELEDPQPEDMYQVGCFAHVKQRLILPDGNNRVMVEVKERAKIDSFESTEPYYSVHATPIKAVGETSMENTALIRLIDAAFREFLYLTNSEASYPAPSVEFDSDPEMLIDMIAANLDLDVEKGQILLEEADIQKRLRTLFEMLIQENEFLKIEQNIDERVRLEMDRNQREFVLREQMRVIQDELGDLEEDPVQQYYAKLKELNPPKVVAEKVETELTRLRKMPVGSSESGVIESYLDWVFDLPWNKSGKVNHSVANARRILNEDHYGIESVKERILEYIAVLKLSKNLKSPILCLVGPPGVGKTSIAKSIARATGRKFARLSLGGMRDEAEIRGHRRTYLGSIPGRIIYQLKMAGVNNPLFLFDEIDKMSTDFKGDPAAALLEVLDPEQNSTFTDNYLELPFDLSNVLFITTANNVADIPEPLLDRMEVIEVNGYIESEKVEIAQRYLVPELLKDHGIKPKKFKITRGAIRRIITDYTRESGVRELKRKLARVCRIAAKDIVEKGVKKVEVTADNLERFLGKRRYLYDKATKGAEVGLATGLAWTTVGGETLQIEVVTVPGTGKIQITGQLGEVMQESAQAALSYIRSKSDELGLKRDFYETTDIHIHVPEGAVPKDGPSAGITIATALTSALTKKPVPGSIAMTGELTLRGRVLPIGGLREKLAAAHRAGISTIIYPEENQKDLEEVPKDVLNSFKMHPVKDMSEVLDIVFGGFNED